MATWYSQELAGLASTPPMRASSPQYGGRVIVYQASIVLQSQAIADIIIIGNVQAGAQFLGGELLTDTSLGSSTIAIGNASSTGKYRAAATYTTTAPTVTPFGLANVMANVQLSATEQQIITVAAAALPASGNLIVQMFWAQGG